MNDSSKKPANLSAVKRSLLAMERMQARIAELEQAQKEPIAVIGIGCRFPNQADDPDSFWRLLRDGVDTIREVPAERWDVDAWYDPDPDTPSKMYTRWGAFLDDIESFDAEFFGIAPREALSMDPQQRLLLEVAWEAIENAAIAPDQLAGTRTGVFIGLINADYAEHQLANGGLADIDAYFGSGVSRSIASGRISYVLGLQGPSISIDTACSSSLVAVHLACQSLRSGECNTAIVGGANITLSPETTVGLSRYKMMAADGRCKTFDASADGYVRGEGCGVVVLKRLSDAVADNDLVLAVVRGSAVGQDGASSGLAAPNGPAQESVIRDALKNAGLEGRDVCFVETHGTGTSLGDPIEIQALGATLAKDRVADSPLYVGSVKTNIGHTESAAGIASLIKAVLAIQNKEIPPNLHFKTPNPYIPWDELDIVVPTEPVPWPEDTPLIAAVSSFGFSGTNAHVILEAAPERQPPAGVAKKSAQVLCLSARDEYSLMALAERYRDHLSKASSESFTDTCYTANAGRAQFPERLAVIARTHLEAHDALNAFIAGQGASANVICGRPASTDRPGVAFLFTGQGSQYAGMGRTLYNEEPKFRESMDRCHEILAPYLATPLLEALYAQGEKSSLINETAYAQPALFAVHYALAELWMSWGIQPRVLIGHSVGEFAAAHLAGVFSLEDALKLVVERGRLMQALPDGGQMVAIFADERTVLDAIAPYPKSVSIAAINTPDSTVISGLADSIQSVVGQLEAAGIETRALNVSHAFHSPMVEPMLDEFESVARSVTYNPPRLRVISNVTGDVADSGLLCNPVYWRKHVRNSVRFVDGVRTLYAQGCRVFLEAGPNPVLVGMAGQILQDGDVHMLASLRAGHDDRKQILKSIAELYVAGASIDWKRFEAHTARQRIRLPTYPFQRSRYWVERRDQPFLASGPDASRHPLLGRRLRSASQDVQFESLIGADTLPFVDDHRLHGTPLLPATAFIELVLAGAEDVYGPGFHEVNDMAIHSAMVFADDEPRITQLIVTPAGEGCSTFKIFSTAATDPDSVTSDDWEMHASGSIDHVVRGDATTLLPALSLNDAQARCQELLNIDDHYQQLVDRGFQIGPSMRSVERVWLGNREALGEILLADAAQEGANAYQYPPALLDACLQFFWSIMSERDSTDTFLPISFGRLRIHAPAQIAVWSHLSVREVDNANPENRTGDVRVFGGAGELLAEMQGLTFRRVSRETLQRIIPLRTDDWLYQVKWVPSVAAAAPAVIEDPAAHILPSPVALSKLLNARLPTLSKAHGLDSQRELTTGLDKLAFAHIMNAFHELGWDPQIGDPVVPDVLAKQLGIQNRYSRLLHRLLDILDEEEVLVRKESDWQVARLPTVAELEIDSSDLWKRFPAAAPQLEMTARCGEHFAQVLSGKFDPLALLFPGGSLDLAEKLYRESPEALVFNNLVQEAITAASEALPHSATLRIAELGAGTGGATSFVLPMLPAERTDYLFTDISPLFLAKAEEKFRKYEFVRYQACDIEQDPLAQGIEGQHYDVVLAVNMIHATSDLRRSLGNARKLLAPGGILVLLEGTGPERWVDITFGLTDGWWAFEDTELRPSYPLLSRQQWISLLAEMGFNDAVAVPQNVGVSQQAVIIAQAPTTAAALAGNASGESAGGWLIFTDRGGVGAELAKHLESRGERALLVSPGSAFEKVGDRQWNVDPARPDHFQSLLAESTVTDLAGLRGILHLWSLDAELPAEHDAALLEATQLLSSGSLLHLVQALGDGSASASRLWVVTRGAQPAGQGGVAAPAQAPIWGLCKVIDFEHPDLECTRIDLNPAAGVSEQAASLLGELAAPSGENQIALRGSGRYVARLSRYRPNERATTLRRRPPSSSAAPVHLAKPASGVLDALALEELVRRAPGPGEVEIRVHATGLNFRDVLIALGAYPGDAALLGAECSGRIEAIGPGVDNVELGQAVIALAPDCFATFAIADANLVIAKPDVLGFDEAATLLSAFSTAYYTLYHLAKLSKGEKVLIHAAAGGVGLAAVQLARRVGAEIFATAGNPEKREFLASLGVEHIMDSRSLEFADQIMTLTDGRGVDVVLNSLAGEFIPKSVSTLAANGRFIEIGKKDIWSEEQVNELRPAASYHVVDLAATCQENASLIGSMLREIVAMLADGSIDCLPRRTFPLEDARSAFRYMAQAKHIGKIVINQQQARTAPRDLAGIIRPQGTYLITGGLGGIGLLVARHLVDHGARHLVLLGRRKPSVAAEDAIGEMQELGARVVTAQADVANREQLNRVFADIAQTMPDLRGVIHSAGVLDDGVLLKQEWRRFAAVMAPKVAGAWNLHLLTQHLSLDFFVLFSSISAVLGSAGQGNHAAANAYLDSLASYRQAMNLPALSINWGVWTEIGAAARQNVDKRVAMQGMGAFSPGDGLQLFERLLSNMTGQVAVMPVDWSEFLRQFGGAKRPLFYSELDRKKGGRAPSKALTATTAPSVVKQLEQAPSNKRNRLLLAHVREQTIKVLGFDAGKPVDDQQPLQELGLDSLMAVELRNLLGSSLELKPALPATVVFDYPTIAELSDYVARERLGWASPTAAATDPQTEDAGLSDALSNIEQMSDEEVEHRFADQMKSGS